MVLVEIGGGVEFGMDRKGVLLLGIATLRKLVVSLQSLAARKVFPRDHFDRVAKLTRPKWCAYVAICSEGIDTEREHRAVCEQCKESLGTASAGHPVTRAMLMDVEELLRNQ